MLPGIDNIVPAAGVIATTLLPGAIICNENIGPERLGFKVQSPTQAAKEGFILNVISIHTHPPLLRLGDNVPTNKVHLLLSLSGAADEIPLDYINDFVDGGGKHDVFIR